MTQNLLEQYKAMEQEIRRLQDEQERFMRKHDKELRNEIYEAAKWPNDAENARELNADLRECVDAPWRGIDIQLLLFLYKGAEGLRETVKETWKIASKWEKSGDAADPRG